MKIKRQPKFEYWKAHTDMQWYWHLKASNGKVIAAGEGYKRRYQVKLAIARFRVAAMTAKTTEIE